VPQRRTKLLADKRSAAEGMVDVSKSVRFTHAAWHAEGVRRFGDDPMGWRFVCPSCGHVASVMDWKEAGAPEGAVAFSCIGRYMGATDDKTFHRAGGPCDYTGGGLFKLNPVEVEVEGKVQAVFAFADATAEVQV